MCLMRNEYIQVRCVNEYTNIFKLDGATNIFKLDVLDAQRIYSS
jgi:hypothetical protein